MLINQDPPPTLSGIVRAKFVENKKERKKESFLSNDDLKTPISKTIRYDKKIIQLK